MSTKWSFSPWWWLILVLWGVLAIGVGAILLIVYRLLMKIRGP